MEDITVNQAHSITIRRHYLAAPEKVWQALILPAALKRWMAPTDAFQIPIAEADVRVGGRYHIVMIAPNGKQHDGSGIYREVSAPNRLIYTWAWKSTPGEESLVRIELRAKDGGTELMLTHTQLADAEARERHEEGWNGCLTRLEKAVV